MFQKYVVFYSTQCMLRAVSMNAPWKDDILAALRCHMGGAGSRGVVADAVRVLENRASRRLPFNFLLRQKWFGSADFM